MDYYCSYLHHGDDVDGMMVVVHQCWSHMDFVWFVVAVDVDVAVVC